MNGDPKKPKNEVTVLDRFEDKLFRSWAKREGINYDNPKSFYDYRGYFKNVVLQGRDERVWTKEGWHYPDTYKQHGHPTFSTQSIYSRGPNDGGFWVGENFVPAAQRRRIPPVVSDATQVVQRRVVVERKYHGNPKREEEPVGPSLLSKLFGR